MLKYETFHFILLFYMAVFIATGQQLIGSFGFATFEGGYNVASTPFIWIYTCIYTHVK